MNGYVKDPAHEALDDAGRRRLHGVAARSVLVAFLLLAANVRKIRTFLHGAALARPGPVPDVTLRSPSRTGGPGRRASGRRPVRTPPLIA
jgi:hypothetical protein